ncbi:MAG: FAD-binding protein [Acidimicrobiia bacterium]|nr:FAD-binding protein [Acidimicrobiia bacterium]
MSSAAGAVAAALEAAATRLGPMARAEEPIGPRTTYRVGGAARLYVEVDDVATLDRVAEVVAATGVPTLVVGQGSNLLVADAGFDGLAIALGPGFGGVEHGDATSPSGRPPTGPVGDAGRAWAQVGGGARLPVVARRLARAGLGGFEWAVGVPGSMGGAVRMNAGGHGSDLAACLVLAEVVDLRTAERRAWSAAELAFGYRRSALGHAHVVTGAELALERGDPARSLALLDEIVAWRRANQPGGQNAGSVFTNPPGDHAGRWVEAAGCKGLRLGSAEVSAKHANFIQADPCGRAGDVWRLMAEVRRRVVAAGGPDLWPETVLVGFPAVAPVGGPTEGRVAG